MLAAGGSREARARLCGARTERESQRAAAGSSGAAGPERTGAAASMLELRSTDFLGQNVGTEAQRRHFTARAEKLDMSAHLHLNKYMKVGAVIVTHLRGLPVPQLQADPLLHLHVEYRK